MNSWKITYVITALCMIAAGLIYLILPVSKERIFRKKNDSNESKIQLENVLYRINDNSIETLYGTYSIDENTKWVSDGKETVSGRARFLGEKIIIKQDDKGAVSKVETLSKLNLPQKIRVVLSADVLGESYIHSKIAITCEESFWSIKDGKIQTHPPKSEISPDIMGKRTIFIPAKEGTALMMISPAGTKEYLGTLEIVAEEKGYSVVNEVSLENYVKGVVPSEMPGSYGEEAAKVQAVCARNYVYNQWNGTEKFACWGAHVDDSVKSQVYGGNIVHEASRKGVEATWGEFLTYNGKPIDINYFSTSCGYTANGNEVWGSGEAAYQKGVSQYIEEEFGDLSTEEGFRSFITDYTVKSFDNHSPWFRWSVEMTREQIQEAVELYLVDCQEVKVVEGNALVEERVNDVGTVKDIFVYERSNTGMVLSILLVGNKRNIVIEGPNEIRKLLGGFSVTLMNEENAGIRDLLPSAFISLEKIKDFSEELISVKIWGGGYGHGVGMSQNGVKGMVDVGYKYQEILRHYFPETELTIL